MLQITPGTDMPLRFVHVVLCLALTLPRCGDASSDQGASDTALDSAAAPDVVSNDSTSPETLGDTDTVPADTGGAGDSASSDTGAPADTQSPGDGDVADTAADVAPPCTSPADCDDGDPCTDDACDPASGCSHAPRVCDDGDACTDDLCEAGVGCAHPALSCDDGNACTVDACDATLGCQSTAVDCDDGNACTTDSCDAASGCQTTPKVCDDGDACTVDSCDAASGCTTTPLVCDDGDACTTDSCDATLGCQSAPLVCDDDNACTIDSCDTGLGCLAEPLVCDDGLPCTLDACDPDVGCVATGVDSACDDGNPCTINACQVGVGCTGSLAGACSDTAPVAEALYLGVWDQSDDATVIYRGQTWTQLTSTWSALSDAGHRLVDFEVRQDAGGNAIYDSLYREGGGGYGLYVSSSESDFEDQLETWASLQLVDFETWTIGSTRFWGGVWLGSGESEVAWDLSWDELLAERSAQSNAGRKIVDIEVLEDGPTTYSAVFHATTASSFLWVGPRWDAFASKVMEIDDQRLVDIEVYGPADNPRYAGVWLGSSGTDRLVAGQPWARFSAADQAHQQAGLQLVDLEFIEGTPVAPVAWAASIHDSLDGVAAGYSYALARDGAIVGYGSAGDARASWEAADPGVRMTPTTRIHLASVSKAISGIVARASGIDLDMPFYTWLQADYPTVGSGVDEVTLRQLLTHRSGIDSLGLDGKRCGPNFPKVIGDLIAADVVAAPGSYDYSNMNFCLLRATLDAYLGQDYVAWANANVFAPMGVLGTSARPDAVTPALYYKNDGASVEQNAGFLWTTDYTAEAGAYGWYASSAQLVRFLIGLRNNLVLSADEADDVFDGDLGWIDHTFADGLAKWHNGGWGTGAGQGLSTCIMRYPDGHDGVVLINTRPNNAKQVLVDAYEALTAY